MGRTTGSGVGRRPAAAVLGIFSQCVHMCSCKCLISYVRVHAKLLDHRQVDDVGSSGSKPGGGLGLNPRGGQRDLGGVRGGQRDRQREQRKRIIKMCVQVI